MPLPPQSLHRLRRRPCSQKLPPPQSLHLLPLPLVTGPVLAEAYCGGRPFFLFTPTIEFRKSFARAVRSFERAPVCSRCANPSTPGMAILCE